MKRLLLTAVSVVCLVSCGDKDDVNVCPTGPYKVHDWSRSELWGKYSTQECKFCGRQRRMSSEDNHYYYQDMKTKEFTVKVDFADVQ